MQSYRYMQDYEQLFFTMSNKQEPAGLSPCLLIRVAAKRSDSGAVRQVAIRMAVFLRART